MNEIHPSVDATVIASEQNKLLRKKQRKALRSLVLRALIGAAIILVLWLFAVLGWVVAPLAFFLEFGVAVWVAVWFGAWLQFRFAEGGLLDAE